MTPYISQISIFGFNYPPVGWALCNGTYMAISDNQILFALLGTRFGGNGTSTFALPDFRGRVPLGQSLRPPYRDIGQRAGLENVALEEQTMPPHSHTLYAVTPPDTSANTNEPADKVLASSPAGREFYNTLEPATTRPMSTDAVSSTGSGTGHFNMQPSLVLNFCIALQGVFPPRS